MNFQIWQYWRRDHFIVAQNVLMTVMTKAEILKNSETFWKLTLQSEQEQNTTGGESAVWKK